MEPCFLKILFIYSWETHRERQRHRLREKQAPCREPHAQLNPRTPGSWPEHMVNHWTTQVPHFGSLFFVFVAYLLWLELPIVFCIEVMKAGILALFLILKEKISLVGTWLAQLVKYLPFSSGPGILGSWDQVLCQAPCSMGSLLLHLLLPLYPLMIYQSLSQKK